MELRPVLRAFPVPSRVTECVVAQLQLTLAVSLLCALQAIPVLGNDDVYQVGPGITPPKLLKKVEPQYSHQARTALVQGTALFEIVIGTDGKPTDITVLSPIGFGLDERAQEAIQAWRFKPAEKDGTPVKARANVQVNFRFPDVWHDAKHEQRRTSYNAALHKFKTGDPKKVDEAVQIVQDLSKQKFPAAAYLYGALLREGKLVPKDLEQGRQLLLFASEKEVGPALYEVGKMYLEGRELPADSSKGMQMIRDAAVMGSLGAQLYLGAQAEAGKGVPQDLSAARRYYRLCAAAGEAACQVRLAKLLLRQPQRAEREYVQALAWLELAAERGSSEAKGMLDNEHSNATPERVKWVGSLKAQLLLRQ